MNSINNYQRFLHAFWIKTNTKHNINVQRRDVLTDMGTVKFFVFVIYAPAVND